MERCTISGLHCKEATMSRGCIVERILCGELYFQDTVKKLQCGEDTIESIHCGENSLWYGCIEVRLLCVEAAPWRDCSVGWLHLRELFVLCCEDIVLVERLSCTDLVIWTDCNVDKKCCKEVT